MARKYVRWNLIIWERPDRERESDWLVKGLITGFASSTFKCPADEPEEGGANDVGVREFRMHNALIDRVWVLLIEVFIPKKMIKIRHRYTFG